MGLSFDTTSLSPFGVAYYTVEYTTTDNVIEVKVDFTDIVQNVVDFGANSVITALNDGVGIKIDELEKGYADEGDGVVYGELYIDYTTADNKESLVQKSWGLLDVVSADEGLSVENGEIRVTADGTVVLSDGENTVRIVITNYERLLADELNASGVDIEVLEGEIPAGSTAEYTALPDDRAADLVSTYNIEETKTEAVIEDHNILDSTTGYTAFDVTIKQPEGDDFTDEGLFNVAVEHPVDVASLIPEGAKVVGINYALYHIHDGEAKPVNVAVANDQVSFTTDSFSEYVLIYTIDFTLDGYTFSYPGKIPFMLSDLLFGLHIDVNAADVVDIQFTNNDLFRVTPVDGDWEIEGIESFTTEEGMTLTMRDGQKIYIFATDPVENPTLSLPTPGTNQEGGTTMTASVSKAVSGTDQNRNASFKVTVNYDLGNTDFQTIKNADGFPTIVYDLNNYIGGTDDQGNPVPIDSLTDMVQPWYDKLTNTLIGQVRIEDNQVIMTITNLDWLDEQDQFGAKFDIQVNIDETKLGTRDEYTFKFPGTGELPPIHFKELEYQKSKSYQFNQHNDNGRVVMEKEDGQYKIHYTVDLTSPIELDTLNFTDTITGKQRYSGNVTITDPTGKTGTVQANSGSTSLNIDVKSALGYQNNEKAPAGRYTVTYTTVISEDDLEEVDSTADVTKEENSATWNVGGDNNIDVPPTEFTPYKDREPVNPTKTVSNEQGHDNNNWQYGDKLDYTITFGSDKKDMAGIKIYDEMTDLQTLNYPVTITYKDKSGATKTVTLSANANDGNGVIWNNDGNYGPGMTSILNYTLPADAGKGEVKVTYSTNIIDKNTAIEKKVYGIQSVKNRVTVNNESKETTGDVTFPDEPKQEKKITSSTKEDGKLVPGSTITYTMTYGSKDIPLKGTTISDEMTKLQNLNAGSIKIKYGTGAEQDMPSDWIKWQTVPADQFSSQTGTVFEHTFGDEAANIYGPITITYTTTLATADEIKNLDISGDQSVANTFKVNNNPTSTYETIPTNKPNTVKKTVKNTTTNSNTWKPGDTLEYTIVFEGDRLAGSTLTDYATDIQILSGDGIKLEFYDSTEAGANPTNTVTLAANGDNIGVDFKDNSTAGYTEDNASSAQEHFHTDSKLLFTYDVPADSTAKRIVATYTMTILDENFAHDILEMYGLKGTNNSAETSKGGSGGTNGNTDYGVKPPIPQTKEVSPADADTDGDEANGWQPDQQLTYTLTYGNGKKNMNGVYIYDAMTDLQNLTSDITIKYYKLGSDGTTFELIPDRTDTIPMSNGGWGTGEVWHANHSDMSKTAATADLSGYTYGTGLTDVFSYTLPDNLPNNGKVKLEITYTTRVIGKDTASKCGVYDVQKVVNNFTVDGETRTTEGDVPFEDSPKPKKKVNPEDADTVDSSKAETEGWQPGAELTYTMTFGDKYTYLNRGSINDRMANIQTLKDEHAVKITWNTYDENKVKTGTKSMYMPVNENSQGVVWSNYHTESVYTVGYNGASDQKTVFDYTFPNPEDNVTFVDGTTGPIGEVYGPVTVTYDVTVMTQAEAEAMGLYGLQTVDNSFTFNNESAYTVGDVPYEDQKQHIPMIQKTGFVDANGEPVFENGTITQYKEKDITVPPEGAKINLDASSRKMTWIIKVSKAEGSEYPITSYNGKEGVDVQELLSRTQSILDNNNGNTYMNLQALYALGLVDIEHARVYTDNRTLYPGTDYTIRLENYSAPQIADKYKDRQIMETAPSVAVYHFDEITEDTYIAIDIYFQDDVQGYYEMANMVSLGSDGTGPAPKISGYNESVAVSKKGTVLEAEDGTKRVIKWTVVFNPDKVVFTPDWDEVNFTDDLPEGLALINYKKFDTNKEVDETTPTVYRYGGGNWNQWGFDNNHPLWGKDENAESYKSGSVLSATVEDNVIQPLNILGYGYSATPYTNHGGLSGTMYTVEYYTYITDEKWAEITSTESGSQNVVNTATFTDGGTRIFSKTTEVTVTADEYLTKKDISNVKTGTTDLQSDDLDYLINVNPHKYMLNDGEPLFLMDTIPTSMNLRVPSIKVFKATDASAAAMQAALTAAGKTEADRSIIMTEYGTLDATLLGQDVTNRVTISYNDDSRVLSFSGLEDEEQYYVFFTAGVRSVGGSETQTFNNTVTLTGKGSHSYTETTTHKTEEFHAEAHGGMGMIKIDEDNAKKTLEGAVFELYEVTTDEVTDGDFEKYTENGQELERVKAEKGKATTFQVRQIISNTADENGQYTSDKRGVISFGTFEFDANKLYYWVEKKAPDGYTAELDVPHYFVMYHALREDDLEADQTTEDLPGLTQANMLRAWALDDWWSESFDITIASYALNATWYATNSQYRSITATKQWEGDSNNIYKLRPEDGVKFTLVRINADGTTTNLDTRVIRGGNENQWPSYTWNKLPIEDEEGNHYKYTVVEEFVENYYPEYSDNGKGIEGGTLYITNHMTPGSTSVMVEKLWQTGGDVPQSIKVKLVQIYTDPDGNVVKMAAPDDLPTGWTDRYDLEATLRVGAGNRWTYTWNELPTRAGDGTGATYSYTVEEVGLYNAATNDYDPVPTENFIVDYSDDGKGIVKGTITITNINPGALKIIKKVAVNGVEVQEGNTLADGTYTFNILDDKGVKVKSVKIKVENGVSEPLVVNDLPEGTYTVREEMPTNGTNLLTGTPKEYQLTVRAGVTADAEIESATFTNNRDTTKLTVKKKWYTDDVDWPKNATATITLVKDGTALTETDRPDATVTLTEDQESYTWTNLDGEATYTITEAPLSGYVAEISEMDENRVITVTNKESRDISFTKSWDGSVDTAGKTWTAEIKLMQREKVIVEYGEKVTGTEPGPWTETGLTKIVNNANPSAAFNGLPKYRHDGTTIYEIEYTVKESSITLDGQDVTNLYSGVVTGSMDEGFSMVNTPARRVPVEKLWDGDIPADVASVEFTLLRNGSADVKHVDGVTDVVPITLPIVDESGNKVWSAAFEDLPQVGDYTIKETRVTYTNKKSVTDETIIQRIFGAVTGSDGDTLTITNKKETFDIPVHKTWEDIDPNTSGLNVSFTLYSVNPSTGKETKVSKDADGNSISATINNVNRNREVDGVNWSTQWKNLPRYDANGVEILYRVRETRVQANGTTYTTTKGIVNNWGEGTWADVEPGEVTDITNKPVKAELVVRKRWSSTIPEDAQVTIALLKDGQPVQVKDVVEGSSSTDNYVFTLPNGGEWYDSISGLQKYDREGNLVNWSVKETRITYTVDSTTYTLYDVLPTGVTEDATHKLISSVFTVQGEDVFSYADGSVIGTQTINNNLPEVHTGSHLDIGLEKVWKDGTKVTKGSSATFTLHQERLALPEKANQKVVKIYASDKTTVLHEGVLDSTASNAKLEFSGSTEHMEVEFKYVKTDAQAFGGKPKANGASYSGTVAVTIDETTLNDNQVLELYVDKSASEFAKLPYIYNDGTWGTSYANNSWTITLTDDPRTNDANNGDWKYIWRNMPQIDEPTDDSNGYRYRYYITEDSHAPSEFTGFEITDGDVNHKLTDTSSITATNSKPPHLDVTKVWSDGKKEIEPPEEMRTVYFKLYSIVDNNGTPNFGYIANYGNTPKGYKSENIGGGQTGNVPYFELTYSNGDWSTLSFVNLPTNYEYYIVECDASGNNLTGDQTITSGTYRPSVSFEGAAVDADHHFSVEDSGTATITNTTIFPDTVPITVEKAWNNADESHTWPEGVEVEVALYRVQGKTQTLVEKPDTVDAASWANPATLKDEDGKRTYTWQGVPTKDGDELIDYIVKETAVTKNNESIVAKFPLQSTVAALTGTTTLTNVEFVDTSLNVKKEWLSYGNEDVTESTTSGTITYTLYQSATEIPQPQTITIDYSELKYGIESWGGSFSFDTAGEKNTTGSGSGKFVPYNGDINVGSTIKLTFVVTDNNNDGNSSLAGLDVEGGTISGQTTVTNGGTAEKEYTISNVQSTLKLKGTIIANHWKNLELRVDVVTQGTVDPSAISTGPATVNNLGTVTVGYSSVSTTLPSTYTVTTGEGHWTSKIDGLPKSDATYTYTYYVEETAVTGFATSYEDNSNVLPNGSTITIKNKDTEPPKGSIVVNKTALKNGAPDTEAVGKTVRIGLFKADQSTADPKTAAIETRTITLVSLESGAVVGGSATFDNLLYDTYYVYEVDAENKAILNGETATVGGIEYTVDQSDAAATVDSATPVAKSISNTRTVVLDGNLKIAKTTDPSDSTQAFTFNVTLTAPAGGSLAASYDTVRTGTNAGNGTQSVTSGTAFTVTLKGGDTWQINGLPAGTAYEVTENSVVGWTNTVKANETGSIVADQTAEASFTNVYSETTATPEGIKTLTGRDWNDDTFSFTLTPTGDTLTAIADGKVKMPAGAAPTSPYAINGTATKASGSGSKTFNFGDITFLEAGTYTFSMTETAGNTTGITYATNTVTVTVTVHAKVDGAFATAPTVGYSNSAEDVQDNEFVNTYDTSTTAQIKGTKAVTNGSGENYLANYEFALTDNVGNAVAGISNATSGNDGKFEFGAIAYTMADVKDGTTAVEGVYTKEYTYKVKEVVPAPEVTEAETTAGYAIRNGVKYTLIEQPVTVTVTYNETVGSMNATVSPNQATLLFTNEQLGKLKLTKTLKETDPVGDATRDFSFTITFNSADLVGKTYSTVVTEAGKDDVSSSLTPAAGEGETSVATVTLKAGQTLEVRDLPIGVTYTVTEAEDSEYAVSSKTNDEDQTVSKDGTTTIFKNERVLGKITVTKNVQLNGAADSEANGKEFWIAVYSDEAAITKIAGPSKITVDNTGSGTVEFDKLPVGTYYVYELTAEDGTAITDTSGTINSVDYVVTTDNTNAIVSKSSTEGAATITNNKSEKGSLTVNKVTLYNEAPDDQVEGKKIKIGLYTDAGTTAVKDPADNTKNYVKEIELGATGVGSVTFSELDYGTYYAYEIDDSGNPVTGESATINQVVYTVGQDTTSVTLEHGASQTGEITITNSTEEKGSLAVTKEIQVGGAASTLSGSFQVALYEVITTTDDSTTPPVTTETENLVGEPQTITVTEGVSTTATFPNLTVGKTYRIYEVTVDDSVSPATVTKVGERYGSYTVSYVGQTVTIPRGVGKAVTGTKVVNNIETTTIKVDKKWFNGSDDITNSIANASITVKLTDGTNAVTADASGETISPITLDGQTEDTAWTYEWTNLPKYNDSGEEITYQVVETSAKVETNTELLAQGTTVTATHDADTTNKPNERHLENTLPKIPIGVEKTWITLAETKPSVTFRIYSGTSEEAAADNTTEAAAPIVLNGTTDGTVAEGVFTQAEGETTGSADAYEDAPWHAQWNNLPKYTDEGALLYYVVKEDAVQNYSTTYPTGQTYAKDTETIANTELTEITAEKAWSNATLGEGDSAVFALLADGVSGQSVTVNGKVDVAENPGEGQEVRPATNPESAYEYEAWKAKWTSLPKYKVQETENEGVTTQTVVAIIYTVQETGFTYGGVTYNVTFEDGAYSVAADINTVGDGEILHTNWKVDQSDNTITNDLNETQVEAAKVWKSGETPMTAWPADVASVEFTLQASINDGTTWANANVVVGTLPNSQTVAKEIRSTDETKVAAWSNLPLKVWVPEMSEPATAAHWADVTYKVIETKVTYNDGKAALETQEAIEQTFAPIWDAQNKTIINTPKTSVSGKKNWRTSCSPDQLELTLKLTRTANGVTETAIKVGEGPSWGLEWRTGSVSNDQLYPPTWDKGDNDDSYTWGYSYTGLPMYAPNGIPYTYDVTEVEFTVRLPENQSVAYTVRDDGQVVWDDDTYPDATPYVFSRIGNDFYNSDETTVNATKIWEPNGASDDKIQSITYKLTRTFTYETQGLSTVSDEDFEDVVTITKVTKTTGDEYEVSSSRKPGETTYTSGWGYTWSDLERYGFMHEDGKAEEGTIGWAGPNGTYNYTVEETAFRYEGVTYKVTKNNSGDYTVKKVTTDPETHEETETVTDAWVVHKGDNNVFTNAKNDTKINVAKVWMENGATVTGPTDPSIKSIEVTLYRVKGATMEIIDSVTRRPVTSGSAKKFTLTTNQSDSEDGHIKSSDANTWSWTIDGLEKYYIDNNGDLKEYEYYIAETKVGDYSIASYSNGTTTANGDNGNTIKVKENGTITVTNSKYSVSLPSTGGPGTTGFYVLGSILTLLALVLLVTKKRSDGAGIE